MCFECCSKLLITKHWVIKIVMQKVPVHRADNAKRQTTKLAVMSWKDEMVATNMAKTLTAGNIGSEWAAVHHVLGRPALKTPVDGHSKLILDTETSSQCSSG